MSFTDLEIPRRLLWKRLTDEGTEGPSTWAEYEVDGTQKNDAGGDWDGSGQFTETGTLHSILWAVPSAGSMPLHLTHAVLAIALNLGTPQGIRTKTEEAFFDPSTRHHERSMRAIMNKLVASVENLQKMSIFAVGPSR